MFPVHSLRNGKCSCGRVGCKVAKHPRVKAWGEVATADPDRVDEWWASQWRDANIGLATGTGSGVWALDVDGEAGAASLKVLEAEHGALPRTLTSETGRGQHLFFRFSAESPVGTHSGVWPGIDVRGEGGYAILPPSQHANGKRYRWINQAPIAEAPTWLTDLVLAGAAETSQVRGGDEAPQTEGERGAELPSASQYRDETKTSEARPATPAAAQAALAREVLRVATAQAGTRNTVLNAAAFNIGQLVGAGLLDRGAVVSTLREAARAAGLHVTEIDDTIKSGLSDGETQPRTQADTNTSEHGLHLLDELLSKPPPQWIVRGMIPEGALGFMVGDAGVGKSATAIYLALKITRGEDFFGHATQPRPIIYIATDDPAFTPLRMFAGLQAHGGKRPDEKIGVWDMPADLSKPSDVARLVREARGLGFERPLFIVDTQAESMSGDENNPKDMGAFIRGCRTLIAAFSGSAAVVLAHPGWNNKERTRGHYSAHGAADFEWFLIRSENYDDHIEIKSGKSRNAPKFPSLYARLTQVQFTPRPGFEKDDPETLIAIAPGDGSEPEHPTHKEFAESERKRRGDKPKDGKATKRKDNDARALAVLRKAGTEGLRYSEWCRLSGIKSGTLGGVAERLTNGENSPAVQRDDRYIARDFTHDES